MAKQPHYLPLEPTEFFADGRSARPLAAGTIARGQLHTDRHLYAGEYRPACAQTQAAAAIGAGEAGPFSALATTLANRPYVDTFPFPITPAIMQRGRERFQIFCAVCHDARGEGNGIVVRRGFTRPPTYHTDRLRNAPVGYFFDVITHGFGAMPSYAEQVPVRDRWAIIAYIRALQMSQHARLADLPEAEQKVVREKVR